MVQGVIIVSMVGFSMYPFAPNGCKLIVRENYPFDAIQAGDVCIYVHNEKRICHRAIVKMERKQRSFPIFGKVLETETCWLMKGDNNPQYDKPKMCKSNYRGKVMSVHL